MSTSIDHWIAHPRGRLFAREWTPAAGASPAAPLVMLHDSLGCVDLWRDFPPALCTATGRRVVAYDRLGFGRSDARTGPPGPGFVTEEASDALPAVLAQLGVDRFVALGHSVGGGMAVAAAARWPARCDALVTIAAQAFVEPQTVRGILAARDGFADPAQFAKLAKYHGDKARWVLDAWVDTWTSPAFTGWSLASVLPDVACPALVLHGERDEYGSVNQPEAIARLCGGRAVLDVLPRLGHVPFREDPARVVALVAGFLAEIAGAPVAPGRPSNATRTMT